MKLVVFVTLAILVTALSARADEPVPDAAPEEAPPTAPEPAPPTVLPAPAPSIVVTPEPTPTPAPSVAVTPEPAITDRATSRNFAGSVQLDYLALSRRDVPIDTVFAGPTVELSLKLAMDLGDRVSANVKVCYACHGFEVGMAYFDLRAADELALRVGRFSPSFGSFPLRHDPANHATSDKPLAYDMGRMVRFRDWNEGILPVPWADNGIELHGSHFFGPAQLDYAAYAVAGPKAGDDPFDFDYTLSRSGERYYIDNNNEPTVGARVALTLDLASRTILTLGLSGMAGHYDPEAKLGFAIVGGDFTLQLGRAFLRAEALARWTQFAIGEEASSRLKYGPDANDHLADYWYKDGFDVELEVPIRRVSLIARWDGLRRSGNVLATSDLSSRSTVWRYTAGVAIRLVAALQLKASIERYDFSDFSDENAAHLGIAGPF